MSKSRCPVPVAAVDPIRARRAVGGATDRVGLGRHQRVDEHGQQLAQQVRVAWANCSSSRRAGSILGVDGHRGVLLRVGFRRSLEGSPDGRHSHRATRSPGSVHHSAGRHCRRARPASDSGGKRLAAIFDTPRTLVRPGSTYPTDADGFRLAGAWWAESSQHWTPHDVKPAHSLAILGEPGIGKTSTIKQLVSDLSSAWVPVDEATSPDELSTLLREAATTLPSDDQAYIIVDGLDESPLPAKAFIRRLRVFLEGSTFSVVLGCRSGAWIAELATMLKATRPDFCEYELWPLSVDDVRQAAELNGMSGQAFVDAVREVGAAPLAMRPLTLNMLIDTYLDSGQLPEHPRELSRSAREAWPTSTT